MEDQPTKTDDQTAMTESSPPLTLDQHLAPASAPQPETEAAPQVEPQVEPSKFETEEAVPEAKYSWQASEYVHHHKGAGWYAVLALIVGVLLVIAVVTKLWLSIGVFVAMGAAIAVYAHKPPRVLTYQLDSTSITIEAKSYPYNNFRSFAVVSDVDWHTIDLEPTQRFMPRLSILFADNDFDAVTAHLAQHLPRTDRKPDPVERLTRYLRF